MKTPTAIDPSTADISTMANQTRESIEAAKARKALAKEVRKGARFLDKKDPGWWEVIDIEALSFSSDGYEDVLGQWAEANVEPPSYQLAHGGSLEVEPDSYMAVLALGLTVDEAERMGLFLDDPTHASVLDELWLGEIFQRELDAQLDAAMERWADAD